MLTSAFKALGDLFSPEFRSVLFKALGLTLALFIAVLIGVEVLLVSLTQFSWPWADWVLGVGTGIALLVAFFFLMSPVTAAFAGLFLDQIAEKVEARHYPQDPRGTPLPTVTGHHHCAAVLPRGAGGQPGGAAGRAVRGGGHRAGGGQRLSPQPRIFRNGGDAPHAGRRGKDPAARERARRFSWRACCRPCSPWCRSSIWRCRCLPPPISRISSSRCGRLRPEAADVGNQAAPAFGLARLADIAPVQDQPVVGVAAIGVRAPPSAACSRPRRASCRAPARCGCRAGTNAYRPRLWDARRRC